MIELRAFVKLGEMVSIRGHYFVVRGVDYEPQDAPAEDLVLGLRLERVTRPTKTKGVPDRTWRPKGKKGANTRW